MTLEHDERQCGNYTVLDEGADGKVKRITVHASTSSPERPPASPSRQRVQQILERLDREGGASALE
jgi:hypothetical protein